VSKQQAGQKGGRVTFERYGPEYMAWIGKRGNIAMRERYELVVVGQSGYALIERATGRVVAIW
jgi:hypothetical protein